MNTFNLPELETLIYEKTNNFIIIGAFDGESHDNFFSKIQEKSNKNNNLIIFVEPIKKYFDELTKKVSLLVDYNVICENFAISDKVESIEMVSVKPNLLDKYGWYIEGCACVVENNSPLNIYMKDVEEIDIDREKITTIMFDDLLSKHGLISIDFLQIDTEGYDERILKTIDFDKLHINFIKFEKHYLSEGFIEDFINKLEVLDYSYYWDNDNYYFVKNTIIYA
jgi:FkbM family methyltransferase